MKETNKASKGDVIYSPVSTNHESNSTKDNLDATSNAPPSEEKTDKKHGNNLNSTSEKDLDIEGKDDKVDNIGVESRSDADKLRDSATETEDKAQGLAVATNQHEPKSTPDSEQFMNNIFFQNLEIPFQLTFGGGRGETFDEVL